MLQAAGVDICDVSAGQTSIRARPVYGRMFQTPFSDRIRNETGMATMAVGNIYEPDHVNSILMAGRADLVCLARPHLADPYWTLHAAARLGDRGEAWPAPYYAGRDQLYRLAEQGRGGGDSGADVMSALAGRHALVTGGGTGIGAAIATALARAGATVTICGRRLEPLQAIAAGDANIRAVAADVTDEAAVAKLYEQAEAWASPSTSSSPMPGWPRARRPHKTSLELWNRTLDVNLTGAFLTVKPALAAMRERAAGGASSSSPRPPG